MYTESDQVIAIEELNLSEQPVAPPWIPNWIVDCGRECEVGIAIDDHCFVVLAKNWNDQWVPMTHIPREVAARLGDLALTNL